MEMLLPVWKYSVHTFPLWASIRAAPLSLYCCPHLLLLIPSSCILLLPSHLGAPHPLEDGPGAGKAQDGPSNDVDATVIRCIQLRGWKRWWGRGVPKLSAPPHPQDPPRTSSTIELNSRSR